MASFKLTLKQVTCAIHERDSAILFCRHHRELLCLSCVTEKKHNDKECSLVSMKDVKQNKEQDSLVLECLQMRQLIKQRKKQRVEFCEVYETLREEIVLKVKNEKESLVEKIEKLAESSKKQAIDGISERKRDLENESHKLDDLQLKLDDLITKIESQDNHEPKNTDTEFSEIFQKIFEEFKKKSEFRDRWTKPSGSFYPSDVNAKFKRSSTLGQVCFEIDEAYASICEVTDDNENNGSENIKQADTTGSVIKQNSVDDEGIDKPDDKKEHIDTKDTAATKPDNSKSKETSPTPTPKEDKQRPKSRFRLGFGKKKSKDLPRESKEPETESEKL